MTDLPPPGGFPPPPPAPPLSPPSAPDAPAPGWWLASDGNWYPPHQQPGYGASPYQPGYAPFAPAGVGTNGLAIASLVLGILWLWWIGSILAVIFGHVALGQTKRTGQGGRGLAIAGLVLGYIGIGLLVLGILVLALGGDASSEFEIIGDDL